MAGVFFFLWWHSWRNNMRRRIQRLKQPKYLAGAIIGVIYFSFYFSRFFIFGGFASRGGTAITPENRPFYEALGAMILCGIALLAWVVPNERAALSFTEAEVAFLFPAPMTRVNLIHYKLLKSQIRILFTMVFFTLIFGRFLLGGGAWIRAVGWWVILSTLNLHMIAASFARSRLMDSGISTTPRRIIVLSLAALAVGSVLYWIKRAVPPPDLANIQQVTYIQYYFRQAAAAGPLPYLLYPFRLVVRPYLTTDFISFLGALWPALLLMGAHYFWVVRSNVSFEEASVDASRRLAERITAIRANRGAWSARPAKKKRPPFRLRPAGPPAVGFLWKNLIGAGQGFTLRFWLMLMWIAIVGVIVSSHGPEGFNVSVFASMLSLIFLFMSLLIGPQFVRHDFRRDLPMMDVLKTYPMRGWQVALGELLAPVAILACLQWLLIFLCAGLTTEFGRAEIPPDLRWSCAIGMAVIAPAFDFLTLLIPNVAVLWFPGWFQTGKDAPQGIEATGQRLIFALGQLLVFALTLLPAGLAFTVVFFVTKLALGVVAAIPLASIAAAIVISAEAALGIIFLGHLFERFDLSAESVAQG